ncbi:MAG: hypothetical protein V3T30_06490, partial [Thermodesulfobacteriota bacterium]
MILSIAGVIIIIGVTVIAYSRTSGRIFMNGDLQSKHRALGADCANCHTPFRGVKTDACLACHTDRKVHHGSEKTGEN